MTTPERTSFHGLPARSLSNRHIHIEYLAEAGPRIVHLSLARTGDNLMAELPDVTIPTPHGVFKLYGGHRLWHSPEAFPRSYLPDNDPIEVYELDGGVRLAQDVEQVTGIQKTVELSLISDRAAVVVQHTLANRGAWPVELACWGLTQMRLGGLAVFPQTAHKLDEPGLLPNRNLVLWPYTRLADPRLKLADDFNLIDAQAIVPPVKIGYMNRHGWMGYLTGGVFFVKRFQAFPEKDHVDFGCNSESYCNDRFIEIESVGPLALLQPGQEMVHAEEWSLYPAPGVPQTLEGVRELVSRLALPAG